MCDDHSKSKADGAPTCRDKAAIRARNNHYSIALHGIDLEMNMFAEPSRSLIDKKDVQTNQTIELTTRNL
jgi:hypothetical protein